MNQPLSKMSSNTVRCTSCNAIYLYNTNLPRCPSVHCQGPNLGILQVAPAKRARSPSPEYNNPYNSSSARPMKAPYGGPIHTPAYAAGPASGHSRQPAHEQAYYSSAPDAWPQAYSNESPAPVPERRPGEHYYAPNYQIPPQGYRTGELSVQSPIRQQAPNQGRGRAMDYPSGDSRVPLSAQYQGPYHDNNRTTDGRHVPDYSHDYNHGSSNFNPGPPVRVEPVISDQRNPRFASTNREDNRRHKSMPHRSRMADNLSNDARRSDPALDRNNKNSKNNRKQAPTKRGKGDKRPGNDPLRRVSATGYSVPEVPTAIKEEKPQKQSTSVDKSSRKPESDIARRKAVDQGRDAPKPDQQGRPRANLDYVDSLPKSYCLLYIHCSNCQSAGHVRRDCEQKLRSYMLPWDSGPSPGNRPTQPATLQQLHAWFAYLGASVQSYQMYVEQRNRILRDAVPIFTEYINQISGDKRIISTFTCMIDRVLNAAEHIQHLQHQKLLKWFRDYIKDPIMKIEMPTTKPHDAEDSRAAIFVTRPSHQTEGYPVVNETTIELIENEWANVHRDTQALARSVSELGLAYIAAHAFTKADPAIKIAFLMIPDFMPDDPRRSDPNSWLAPVRWPSCQQMIESYNEFFHTCQAQFEKRRQLAAGPSLNYG